MISFRYSFKIQIKNWGQLLKYKYIGPLLMDPTHSPSHSQVPIHTFNQDNLDYIIGLVKMFVGEVVIGSE